MQIAERVAQLDWPDLERSLWERGHARTPPLLTGRECEELAALYDDDRLFRSRVVMERHRFGVGEYKYFARPLPGLIDQLRRQLYPRLANVANRWAEALGRPERFPDALDEFLDLCARNGQTQPTPLLLHYEAGGYNCLHRDLYGDVVFPLQATAFLSRP